MSRKAWLTPDSIPTATLCRRCVIPDDLGIVTAVTGALDLLGDPNNWEEYGAVTPEEIASTMRDMMWRFVNEGTVCMIGAIVAFATANVPDNALECDGGSYAREDYQELYDSLDSVYILDDNTFIVPDLRGRVVVGLGTGSGLSPRSMDESFGVETHTLVTSEIPAHNHTQNPHTHTELIAVGALAEAPIIPVPSAIPGAGVTGGTTATNNATGGDGAHENMQPSLVLRYCIIAK